MKPATTSLKGMRKDFEKCKGYELLISGIGKVSIDNNGRVTTKNLKSLEEIIENITDFEDYGKTNYGGTRADFYFKNGKRAFTIFIDNQQEREL